MKSPMSILALLIPVTVIAQNYPVMGGGGMGGGGMSQQDMQKMMQQMEAMEACMQDIDQSQFKALEQDALRVEAGVKSLCTSGKRDEAQQEAITFAREIANNPEIRKMKKCGGMMTEAVSRMPYMEQIRESGETAAHVCDQ